MCPFVKILWLAPFLIVGCAGTRPSTLGVRQGKLAPCPKSPNCVSTQSLDPGHRVDPLAYTTSPGEARGKVVEILKAMPRTDIVTLEEDYLHAECRSKVFGFVDDVEFWFDDANSVIHFRSASRMGYSDLGVNRKRMERIRIQFSQAQPGR
jgi:uncharacterized protein (DUF1499 family)